MTESNHDGVTEVHEEDMGSGEEVEEIEVEEEVEVTDEEEEETNDSPVRVETPKPSLPKAVTPSKAKRVVPSDAVKNMRMDTPEKQAGKQKTDSLPSKQKTDVFPVNKSPFPTFGNWTPEALSRITIDFPTLGSKEESTNDLTRANNPEHRYWKGMVLFRYGQYTSETIRIDNVFIPFSNAKGYGSSYLYLCLPGHAAEAFAAAGKARAPTAVNEKSLVPDNERWWKIANNVDECFGIMSKQTGKFHPKSIESILEATQSGISCNVVLEFYCKASTVERRPLTPTVRRTVAIKVLKGYINDMGVDVQLPNKVPRSKVKSAPVATSRDVAPDSLMRKLAELGL